MIDYNFPMIIGEEEVLTERQLLTGVQSGLLMEGAESVRFIVIHCSATRADRDYTVEQLLRDHRARGFRTIGYHFYIRRSGELTQHRKLLEVGAHAKGYNRCSIGVCYEGGIAPLGPPWRGEKLSEGDGVRLVPADTRTPEQKQTMRELILKLHKLFPQALVLGHRDLPGVKKDCRLSRNSVGIGVNVCDSEKEQFLVHHPSDVGSE